MAVAHREIVDGLRLIRSESVGPVTYRELVRRLGTAGEALRAIQDLSRRGGRQTPLRLGKAADAEAELAMAAEQGAQVVMHGDAAYPALLHEIPDAPPILYALGDIAILNNDAVAIVGARNASAIGMRFARDSRPIWAAAISWSCQALPAASMRPPIAARSTPQQSPLSPVALIKSIRPRTKGCFARFARRDASFRRCHPARCPRRAISRVAIGSSRGRRRPSLSLRALRDQARSLRRGLRANRAAMSWLFPVRRSTRAPVAPMH